MLPPAADTVGQAVAQITLRSRGNKLAFTARSSGKHKLRVVFLSGGGTVTASVAAIGTAIKRAPVVDASGVAQPVGVACYFKRCQIAYHGAGLRDGDGSAAVMRLDAMEGTAYAVEVALAAGERGGAQVSVTFFAAGAAAGAAGFPAVLAGPLGVWRATPHGHSSLFAHWGCGAARRAMMLA
jgi:hypothetical protein